MIDRREEVKNDPGCSGDRLCGSQIRQCHGEDTGLRIRDAGKIDRADRWRIHINALICMRKWDSGEV